MITEVSPVKGSISRKGQAAAPVDVGLDDIQRVLFDEALEAPAGVFVLRTRQRDARLGLELDVAVDDDPHPVTGEFDPLPPAR